MSNKPITSAEVKSFKEDKKVSRLVTGMYPNRKMRRYAYQRPSGGNRADTPGRLAIKSFFRSLMKLLRGK